MRRLVIAAAVLLVAAGLWFWFGGDEAAKRDGASGSGSGLSRAQAQGGPSSRSGGAAIPPSGAGSAATPAVGSGAVSLLSKDEPVAPGRTPPLENPATEADGLVEVLVTAGQKPLSDVSIALYWRGGVGGGGDGRGIAGRGGGGPLWRVAGSATTGKDGTAKLPARPGAYLVSAHAQALAPVTKEFLRPSGAPVTRVELALEVGAVLEGRTLSRVGQEPVALATITAAQALRGPRGLGGSALPPEERLAATSDPNGRFKFTGLGEGTWRIEASAPGHARAIAAQVAVPQKGELVLELPPAAVIEGAVRAADGSPGDGAEVIALGAGTAFNTVAAKGGGFSLEVDPGQYQLSATRNGEAGGDRKPVAVAAGATVRGVVIQLGKPAAIAGTVTAQATAAPIAGAIVTLRNYQSANELASTVTESSGTFAIEGLAPGAYDLATRADGFLDQLRSGVTVAIGQRFPLQIVLTGTGSVAGVVRDGGGRTVVGARVRAGAGGGGGFGPGGGGAPGAALQQALSDNGGHYRIDGLRPGTARISAARDAASFGPSRTVDVSEGQETPLDLALADNGSIKGRVTTRSGQPVAAGTTVRAMQSGAQGGFQDGAVLATADADAAGAFQLSVPPGNYRVFAGTPGAGPGGGGRRQSPALAAVAIGQVVIADLVIDDTSSGTVGTVVEPTGGPAAGAAVALLGTDGQVIGLALADGEGKFNATQFRGATPASVRARNGGRVGDAPVGSAAEVAITLRPAATLHGKISAGDPPASFTVTVAPTDPTRALWGQQAQAAAQEFTGDSFDLFDVPGLDVTVSVKSADGRTGKQPVSLQPGQEGNVTVTLQEAASISGRVLGQGGKPAAGAGVLLDGVPRRSGTGTSGTDGRFKVTGIMPGDHEVVLRLDRTTASAAKTISLAVAQALDLGEVILIGTKADPGSIGASFFNAQGAVALGSLLNGGPAQLAGLRENDLLVTIDGTPVLNTADAKTRSTGAPGSTVAIGINRGGVASVVQVVRALP